MERFTTTPTNLYTAVSINRPKIKMPALIPPNFC